jgi:PelA/Pel-15E family pectate lyase
MTSRFKLFLALSLGFAQLLPAAIIGTNPPSQPLVPERIATLPAMPQPAWKEYLERSSRQLQADQTFLHAELKEHGLTNSTIPPEGRGARSVPLDRPAAWYGQAEGRRIADIVVSFQTPAGGWSKNLDMSRERRAPGERFACDNGSRYLGKFDNDVPRDANWSYVGTFDNDATTTQLRFLAKAIAAVGHEDNPSYRAAFGRGLDYILAAQYPNGGWPQVWPLEGGYHDSITYNDGAMLHVLELLSDVAEAQEEFRFVSEPKRALAAASLKRGLECILATQIVVNGHRTVWCQQHDALTLQPTSARNYEMPSQTGGESAEVMMFLMQRANPSPEIIGSVKAAAAWFEKTQLHDVAYRFSAGTGRHLVAAPGNGPLWARYYQIGTDRPIFGDRDKTIHDDVDEISQERRNGYAWYTDTPKRMLQHYARWHEAHP